MAKRTNDLHECVRPIAEAMAGRCGTLKNALSAGILALNDLSPEKREHYLNLATGVDQEGLKALYRNVLGALEEPSGPRKSQRRKGSAKSS
ncbi:MAG: hypothetical protein JXA82_05815 [Sedimentisphaerales bacterium]|nr:hypothetical protein [Sedimentisphaerales bacterium]